MKTNAIIRIIIWSIVILLLLGILGGVLALDTFSFHHDESSWAAPILTTGSGEHHHEDHVLSQPETVTHIEIDWVAGTVTIQPGDTDRIQLSESGRFDTTDAMVYRQYGKELTIEYSKQDVYVGFYSAPVKDLTITVPRDWEGISISLDTASADLHMTGITVREVELDSASGTAVFENCTIEELDLDTASGDLNYTGTLNTLECDAASANVHAVFSNAPRSVNVDAMSGNVDITLPENCGFAAQVETLSGDFHSDFDCTHNKNGGYVHGSGDCRIDISAASGNVHIRKGK